jgi:hypothetical protein
MRYQVLTLKVTALLLALPGVVGLSELWFWLMHIDLTPIAWDWVRGYVAAAMMAAAFFIWGGAVAWGDQ